MLKGIIDITPLFMCGGHVIMILVDLAHGKPKHVPYRDSRLTFLLQDSLGGNSKTMIIANVSPSVGSYYHICAADTLNTLKFAQHAKLIQNNVVVNEDSTGDVNALQHQIRLLKEELLLLIEAHQQECNEKEQEILLLLSELRGKTSTITELEDKVEMAKDCISKMSVCVTAAFVIVNRQSETTENNLISLKHKDIQLKKSPEMNLEKDALLTDQAALIEEAEKQIQSLRKEVTELEETCAQLGKKLSEEEQRANAIEQKLEDIEDNDILKTREKLSEQKAGVSTLWSCVGLCLEDDKIPERYNADGDCSSFDGSGEGRSDAETNKDDVDVYFVEDLRTDDSKHCFKTRKSSCSYSYDQKLMESGNGCKDVCERDATIVLVRLEIESALKSLKEVQAEMIKLHGEKEEMLVSKKQNEQGMKCLVTQLLTLQATVDNFEKQSELKMEAVNRKLGEFEQIVHEAGTDWCQMKEILEHEVGDAKIIAVQKATEASCIFAKFEEAQDTMKEVDIMINGLLIANETMKLDKEKLKQTQVKLNERNSLINEFQSLQSINDLKDQQLEHELLAIIEEMGISMKTNFKYITAEEKERTIAAARLFRPKNPSFMVIMRPRDLCNSTMYVPVGFAKKYLISRDAELIKLQDRDGREWSVNSRKACVGGGGGYFICGWTKFLKDKNLKEGDICMFELIKEKNIVLKVSVFDSSTSFSKSNSSLVIRTV